MDAISVWWAGLTAMNQCFYGAAAFFGLIFLWQLITSLAGLAGSDADLGSQAEGDLVHHSPEDAQATVAAFKLLSMRSILAFCTLFTWAAALYLNNRVSAPNALLLALLWGAAAMVISSLIPYAMKKLTETGNIRIASCLGKAGTVYMDIPEGGQGEVRVACSGVQTHVKARGCGKRPFKAGTPVRVVRMLEPSVVEVDEIS